MAAAPTQRLSPAFWLAVLVVLILALFQVLWTFQPKWAHAFAIYPRAEWGWIGVATAPLVHGSWGHLASNLLGLVPALAFLTFRYPQSALRVMAVCWFLPSLYVYFIARPSYHLGASGWLYGLLLFLMTSGILRRDRPAMAVAFILFLLNQGFLLGVLPLETGISWESHLAGAGVGIWCAFLFRRLDPPPHQPEPPTSGPELPPEVWDYRLHLPKPPANPHDRTPDA